MKTRSLGATLTLALLLTACGDRSESAAEPGDENGAEAGGEHAKTEEARTGEHGGRLLEMGGYAVELAIEEDGTPPKYQAWLYQGGKALDANAGTVEVRL